MKLAKIEEIALKTLANNHGAQPLREPGYIYHHGKRVAKICSWLAEKINGKTINHDILYVAALFHDVGKGKAHHALAGSKMIGEVLGSSVTATERKEIERLIREHNLRETPNKCNKDSKILQDADILDHFGAQGVWLSTCITLKSDRSQEQMLEYVNGSSEKDYIKLRYNQLNFSHSKTEFKRRLRLQRNFFKRLKEECFI